MAHEIERLYREARLEIPVLIEHVIRRQQRLVMSPDNGASLAERRGIEERFSRTCRVRSDTPDDQAEPLVGQGGDAIEQVEIRADEGVVVQQVAWRIPGGRQLREHGELRPGRAGAVDRRADLLVGVLERANREIQLREGNAHSQFLHLAARS